MAVCGPEGEAIDVAQLFDFLHGLGRKGRLAFEGVQHDSLQQVSERKVLSLGQSLEDLEETLLHADPGLHSFDFDLRILIFIHVINVPQYQDICTASKR